MGVDWSDADGRKLRMNMKTAKDPKWHQYLSDTEKNAVQQWMEWVSSHTQFVYHATGLPGVFKDPVWGMAFKLQSYPMNYVFKYMADTSKMLVSGGLNPFKPGVARFDTTGKYKVPPGVRFGILKHFIGLGLAVKVFEEMGMDFRDIVGASYDPDAPIKVRTGVLNFRPSPAMQLVENFRDIWSNDEYVSKKAIMNLKRSYTIFVPGYLAGKDIQRALEQGERRALLFRKPFESGRKRKEPEPESFFDVYKGYKNYKPFSTR